MELMEVHSRLVAAFAAHLGIPGSVSYRTEIHGALEVLALVSQSVLLKALREIGTHFPQSRMEKALAEAAIKKQESWLLYGNDLKEWVTVTAKQIRAMLRDVQQACMKKENKKTPDWAQAFISDADAAHDIEMGAWLFKYDTELKVAYRFKPEQADCKEWCDHMVEGNTEMVASWSDGVTWPVPGLKPQVYRNSATQGDDLHPPPDGPPDLEQPAKKQRKGSTEAGSIHMHCH